MQNLAKNSISSFTNGSKTSVTFDNREKSGQGWTYNDVNLAYNSATDPDDGNVVYYNGFGSTVLWSNLAKT